MRFEDLKVGMTVLNLKTNKTSKIVEISEKAEGVTLSNKNVRFWSTYDITWKVIELVKITKQQEEDMKDIVRWNSKEALLEAHSEMKNGKIEPWTNHSSLNSISVEEMKHLLEYGYEVISEPQNEVEMVEELYGENAIEEMLQPQSHPNCRISSDVLDSFRYALDETIERKKKELKFSDLKVGMHVRFLKADRLTIEGEVVQLKAEGEIVVLEPKRGKVKNVHFNGPGRTWVKAPLHETNLSEEDDIVLWDMYVDMAIATSDKEWFDKLTQIK